jgi:iron complex outermembrane recepter protein
MGTKSAAVRRFALALGMLGATIGGLAQAQSGQEADTTESTELDELLLGGSAQAEPAVAESTDPLPVIHVADKEPPVEQAAPRPSSRLVEEIVVTAQKREENLQEVPISIAAYSGDALDVRGVLSAEDLKFVTPGLVYDNLVGYALIYMRGVGTEVFAPHAEPSVATYIDGIYFPFAHGLAQDFTKLERVEVVKGPQGTLFGRNATGGAINVISKQPSDEWEITLDAGLRNYSGRMTKAYITGPLFGGLSFSVSGLYDYDEPYYELLPDSPLQELQPNESKGVNPRLRWQITDSFSAMVSAYAARFFGTGTVINTNTDPTPMGTSVGASDAGDRKASVNEPSTIEITTDVVYGQLLWEADIADIKVLLTRRTAPIPAGTTMVARRTAPRSRLSTSS